VVSATAPKKTSPLLGGRQRDVMPVGVDAGAAVGGIGTGARAPPLSIRGSSIDGRFFGKGPARRALSLPVRCRQSRIAVQDSVATIARRCSIPATPRSASSQRGRMPSPPVVSPPSGYSASLRLVALRPAQVFMPDQGARTRRPWFSDSSTRAASKARWPGHHWQTRGRARHCAMRCSLHFANVARMQKAPPAHKSACRRGSGSGAARRCSRGLKVQFKPFHAARYFVDLANSALAASANEKGRPAGTFFRSE
jgi:hypothetical protein